MKNNIPVFFSVDDNYAPFLNVTLESITSNASKHNHYDFYILNNRLKSENKDLLLKFNRDNFTINFVNMAEKIKDISAILHTRDYYTKAIYYRLFIPTLFPNLDKAIYMDCDIVVQSDVAELFAYDVTNNLLGAIADEAVSLVPEFQAYTKNCLGIEWNRYFNSGVLVMNLKELRAINFETKFFNALTSYKLSVAPDQDYLNVICKDRITYIPKIWNKMPFKDSTLNIKDLKLIHYNLSYKPWHYDNIEYQDAFWKYTSQAGMIETMQKFLKEFNDTLKQKDALSGKRLLELADSQSKQQDTLLALLQSGEIDSNTYLRRDSLDPDVVLGGFVSKVKVDLSKKFKKN